MLREKLRWRLKRPLLLLAALFALLAFSPEAKAWGAPGLLGEGFDGSQTNYTSANYSKTGIDDEWYYWDVTANSTTVKFRFRCYTDGVTGETNQNRIFQPNQASDLTVTNGQEYESWGKKQESDKENPTSYWQITNAKVGQTYRLWFKNTQNNIGGIRVKATWTPVSENKTYYLRGDWSDGWTDAGQLSFAKVNDTTYEIPAATVTASNIFKVYCPQISTNNGYVVVTAGTQLTGSDNLKLESTPEGTVKFTLTVDGSGNPTRLDASYNTTVVPPTPGGDSDYYMRLATSKGQDPSNGYKQLYFSKTANPKVFTLSTGLDDTDYFFRLYWKSTGDTCYGADAGCTAGDGLYTQDGDKFKNAIKGDIIEFTLTVGDDGKPAKISAKEGGVIYLYGNKVNGQAWTDTEAKGVRMNTSDHKVYTLKNVKFEAASGKDVAYLSFGSDLAKWTEIATRYVPEVNDTQCVDDVTNNVIKYTDAANAWTIAPGMYNVTLDIENMTLVVDFLREIPAAGMPFYPAGISTNAEFIEAKIDADKYFYYLVGHSLNNGNASPEWEMLPNGDGTYSVDFTWQSHCSGDFDQIMVKKFHASDETGTDVATLSNVTTAVSGVTPPSSDEYLENSTDYPGWRVRATYNPTGNSITLDKLAYDPDTKGWVVATNGKAQEFPFVSLVGEKWGQQDDVPEEIGNAVGDDFGGANAKTTAGWQNAWIQYDGSRQPITSRDGSKVYFNTQWPPLKPIMMKVDYTVDGDTEERTMFMNSGNLTFTPMGEATGQEWKADSEFAEATNLNLEDGETYRMYKVNNLWANGKFKIWSGWNGHRRGGASEWDKNWNWGYIDQGTNVTTIGLNNTYKLGLKDGDMQFENPTYMYAAYFFLNVNTPRSTDIAKECRFYTMSAFGGAKIHALSNKDNTQGTFDPSLDEAACQNVGFTSVKINIYPSTVEDYTTATPLSTPLYKTFERKDATQANLDAIVKEVFGNTGGTGVTKDYYQDAFNYKSNGYYYYTLTINFIDNNGEERDITVKSNPYYIGSVSTSVFTAQLVEVQEGATDYSAYKYVTYQSGATEAYGVSADGNTVTKLNSVPGASFYSDRNQALWTNKVLVYSPMPWDEHHTGYAPTASVQKWTLNVNNNAEVATSSEQKDFIVLYDAPDFALNTFEVVMSWRPTEADEYRDKAASAMTRLRFPTACMTAEKVNVAVSAPVEQTVSLSADSHYGHLKESNGEYVNEIGDGTYVNMLVRHLDIVASLDMPNVTSDLRNLLADATTINPTLNLTTNIEGMSSKLPIVKLADAEGKINLTYINPMSLFNAPTPSNPISEKDGMYVGLGNQSDSSDLALYQRSGVMTTNVSANPSFEQPEFADDEFKIYRSWIQQKDGEGNPVNKYTAYIYLESIPAVTDNGFTVGGTKMTDAAENAYLPLYINGSAVDALGHASTTESQLFSHEHLTTNKHVWNEVIEGPTTTWYAEMWDDLKSANAFHAADGTTHTSVDLAVNHTYIFAVDNSTIAPAPANGRRNAPATPDYVALHGPGVSKTISLTNIITGVEGVEIGSGNDIVTGEGFIDMMGNEAMVFTVDGRQVYVGNDRVDVASGVYLVRTAAKTFKVLVK